jgi:HD-GYP domain-containing protein (c-di-GMP phosphodiesterase class II)
MPGVREVHLLKAQESYLDALEILAQMQEARDPYSRGHCWRVERLALLIAAEIGGSVTLMTDLAQAARAHDVGKLAVRDGTLLKAGPLNATEWASIRQHPAQSARLLRFFGAPESVISLVEGHHERYDGRGYPNGLSGEDIPLGARLLAVADAYDALTSERPYRRKLTDERAMEVLARGAGAQWDRKIVEALARVPGRQVPLFSSHSPSSMGEARAGPV